MANQRPAPRQPVVTSGTTRGVFIAFGVVGAVLIAALAFILGQTAVNPTSRGLEEKLVLVRQKAATCSQERDRLRAKQKREPDYRKSPAYKIQEENDRLADQNNELMTDNESLRDEKAMLEETLTELRFDLDKNSIITDEENKKLENFQRTGNMSDSLAAFIQDQLLWGGVDKDELLTKLMDELKWKKQQFQKCSKDIQGTKERLEKAKTDASKTTAEKAKTEEPAKPAVDPSKFSAADLEKLLALAKANEKPAEKPAEKPVADKAAQLAELLATWKQEGASKIVQKENPVVEKKPAVAAGEAPVEEMMARLQAEKLKQNPTQEKPLEKEPASPTNKLTSEEIKQLLAKLGK